MTSSAKVLSSCPVMVGIWFVLYLHVPALTGHLQPPRRGGGRPFGRFRYAPSAEWPGSQVLRANYRRNVAPPNPGQDIAIPPRAVVKFKPGKEMKEKVAPILPHLEERY